MRPFFRPVTLLVAAMLALAATGSASVRADTLETDGQEAWVEIVEFGDLECPFTARAEETLDALRKKYGKRVRVLFRHKPLPFHNRAMAAARAMQAAWRQGKGEEMKRAFLADIKRLSDDDFIAHAQTLGLDIDRFKTDLADVKGLDETIKHDIAIADAAGATGTPTFFVNGIVLRGAQPIEKFDEVIGREIMAIMKARNAGRMDEGSIEARTALNNQDLHNWIHRGIEPPPPAAAEKKSEDETVYKVTVDVQRDGIIGPTHAPVTMVIFTGYQCPFCRKLEPTVQGLRDKYGTDLRIVYKHLPLDFHVHSRDAAAAAICAREQGMKGWDGMHKTLMELPYDDLVEAKFVEKATELKLNVKRFRTCLGSPATKKRIDADIALAGIVSARGTPNSFVNGRKIVGSQPFDTFVAAVDRELALVRERFPKVPVAKIYDAVLKDATVVTDFEDKVHVFPDDAPIIGNPKAKTRITAFIDTECPFTARAMGPLLELVAKRPRDVAVAIRHFPLSFHANADSGAHVGACLASHGHADKLGAYLKAAMADLKAQPMSLYTSLEGLGLKEDALAAVRTCAVEAEAGEDATGKGREAIDAVARDKGLARDSGVRGTPTFFFNGRLWKPTGGYQLEGFERALDTVPTK
jgi:protein-disulfide isomerase